MGDPPENSAEKSDLPGDTLQALSKTAEPKTTAETTEKDLKPRSREDLLARLEKTLCRIENLEFLEEAIEAVEKSEADRIARRPALVRQLEFYFSDANLRRDKFLREKIEAAEEGWVPISVILPFNRLKLMGCKTSAEITAAVEASDRNLLELSAERDAVRRFCRTLPAESSSGAGSEQERRSVQLQGFTAGDETVTIDAVTALCAPFGSTAFVRLLRDSSGLPTREGQKPFLGVVEVEFESEEAAKLLLAAETPLAWDGKELKVRLLADVRKEFASRRRPTEGEGDDEDDDDDERPAKRPRKSREEQIEMIAASIQRGCLLRFDNIPPAVTWRDIKDGLRPYGSVAFVKIERCADDAEKAGHAVVRIKDAEDIDALMDCAQEDEGCLSLQCWPSGEPPEEQAKKKRKPPPAQAEEAGEDEEPVASLLESAAAGEGSEASTEKKALVDPYGGVSEAAAEAEGVEEEAPVASLLDSSSAGEAATSSGKKDAEADDDDSVEASKTIRLPVRKLTGEEEEEHIKQAAAETLLQKEKGKGDHKGFKGKKGGKDKGKDGKGKWGKGGKDGKGKGKGKKGSKGGKH